MDSEKLIVMLTKKKDQARIDEPLSDIGKAFNDGVETMLNLAVSAVLQYEMKGGFEDDTDCRCTVDPGSGTVRDAALRR